MTTYRLEDPDKLITPDIHDKLEQKISECITKMLAAKEFGGNPFLFALVASKPHRLTLGWPGQDLDTAATDGKTFYWNPKFLERLSLDLVRVVMEHEAYHNVFFHTHPDRAAERNPKVWNIAIDYVVNTVVVVDRLGSLVNSYSRGDAEVNNIFGSQAGLGDAMNLETLLKEIKSGKVDPTRKGKTYLFADRKHADKSADWIYEEIMEALEKHKCPGDGGGRPGGKSGGSGGECSVCGGKSMDQHISSKQTKEEATWEVMKAANVAKSIGRGDLPAGIADMIDKLGNPTLRPADIIRMAIMKQSSNSGINKDFKRFRRRGLSAEPEAQYIPRYFNIRPRWLAMLDTSGSHDTKSMARGVKELKLVGDNADGLIVPCDAQPYWDKAVKVSNIDDIAKTSAHGRGGTVFEKFFAEIKTKTTGHFDVVVVITDGLVEQIPMRLHPGCDCLWLQTNSEVDYKPTFGRVIRLTH